MGVSVKGGKRWKAALKPYSEHPNGGVLIGVTERDTYVEGPAAETGLTVLQNLTWHEFGTSRMPARAPLRSTARDCRDKWARTAATQLKLTHSVKDALNEAGRAAAMEIQRRISNGMLEPPLNEKTVQRKIKMGRVEQARKPVVLTGTLMRAIQHQWIEDLRSLA